MSEDMFAQFWEHVNSHRKSYENYIAKSDLLSHNGSINEEAIHAVTQQSVRKLRSFFSDETISQLQEQIQRLLQIRNLTGLTELLFLHLAVAGDGFPLIYAIITVHEQIFVRYCSFLCEKLKWKG